MNSRDRQAWNRAFLNSWRQLQLQARERGRLPVQLDERLRQAGAMFRDKGHNPESTARGLYMGTEHARAAQS